MRLEHDQGAPATNYDSTKITTSQRKPHFFVGREAKLDPTARPKCRNNPSWGRIFFVAPFRESQKIAKYS